MSLSSTPPLSFSSASEESHTDCARPYGNTPMVALYPGKILLRAVALIQDDIVNCLALKNICHSGRLTQTNVIQSASEESHTSCARSYGNTPCKQEDYPGKILRRTDVLLWMTVLVFGPSLDDNSKVNKCHSEHKRRISHGLCPPSKKLCLS